MGSSDEEYAAQGVASRGAAGWQLSGGAARVVRVLVPSIRRTPDDAFRPAAATRARAARAAEEPACVVDLAAHSPLLGEAEPAGPGARGVLTGQMGGFTHKSNDGLVQGGHRLRSQTADSDQTKEQASVSLLSKEMAGDLLLIFLREARHRQPPLLSVQVMIRDSGGGPSSS